MVLWRCDVSPRGHIGGRRKTVSGELQMAKKLGVNQEQISRLEGRMDLHISTLRRTIQAMGGELELLARFPGAPAVKLSGFSDLDS